MEFDTRAFFVEHEEPTVSGFMVIESSQTGPGYGEPSYRIAEKWDRPDGDTTWTAYWIPEATLLARIERGECEYAKQASESQYEGVLNLAGVSVSSSDKVAATA